MYKSVAMFVGKCVIFVAIFWLSFFVIYGPYRSQSDGGGQTTSSQQTNANQQAMQKYSDQLKRSEQILDKQAELLGRWEKVIEQWESVARNSAR